MILSDETLDEIEERVMSELKDFQRSTVEHIDSLYRSGQNRILVSDEVGLGKTLIARGTIAKFTKLRKEEGDNLVKVVYICSNSAIAQQNIEKLRISEEINVEDNNTSRLSMQHLNIFDKKHNRSNKYIQLIPLTPETSFKISNSQGTIDERALIYSILYKIPELRNYQNKLKKILNYGTKNWDYPVKYYIKKINACNNKSNGEYLKYMQKEVLNGLKETKYENTDLLTYLKDFSERFDENNNELKFESRKLIIELRKLFANISLNLLDPDLIIMDEFQRFKYLLNSDEGSDMQILANKFFNSDDVRILMLSATPYKMYSTLDELDENLIDEHYSEFYEVINFLKTNTDNLNEFKVIWENYSTELKELSDNNSSFILIKNKAENELYKNICRTERITENTLADFIDDSSIKNSMHVLNEDITSYIKLQKLLDDINLNSNVPIDYIKSSPYLLSFMKDYKLKRKIENYFKKHPKDLKLIEDSVFWLNNNDINEFKKIEPNNARFNKLIDYALEDNAELLLWIPPSKPYYPHEGVYKNSEEFSKIIIFSSWEMVPRMISSLVSYEIERRTIGKISKNKPNSNYFSKKRFPGHRMTFNLENGIPRKMNLFTLIYTSTFLSDCYNPIDCLNRELYLKEIENEIKTKIKSKIKELDSFKGEESVRDDSKWYYLAPLLLDNNYSKTVNYWFKNIKDYVNPNLKDVNGFLKHIYKLEEQFNDLINGKIKLGKQPDDLMDVLCDVAIASPASCIYRSYKKEVPENANIQEYTKIIIPTIRLFINRMNLPQSIATIDLASKDMMDAPYWKKMLNYCKNGNLQAMFDEYVHLISNGLDKNNTNRVKIIDEKIRNSMEFRATSYDIDTYDSFTSRIRNTEIEKYYMRTHYAASFTKGRSDEKDADRKKTLQNAFNSPFRPFILASTSIGQEGLDFHNYCRKIIHWNLPSNPIDLEQREGRINRFECLAIRQNIAKRYGNIKFKDNIWTEMFKKASEIEQKANCSDLIPYWGLTETEDMIKIERIVPMYPFSKDMSKYQRLIKILSVYRLTLGQARQEELLEYLFNKQLKINNLKELFINLSPYYKNNSMK